ncbi:MAG: hypothetical protein K2H01_12210, partial [Ruminococcus sp.]|nr:hypothetical protein [Ruminococcus sp.]
LETLYISHYFLNNFSAADSVYNEIIQAGFQPPIGVINCMARNHPEDALNLFNEYAQKNNIPLEALDMDFTIAIAYIKKGDIDSAIQSMDRFITSQNSFVSNMGAHLLDRVQHEHDVEITHEQAESARYYRRVSLITLLILSLLITLGILIITRFRNRQKMQRLQLERNLVILESEYNFIKSQLEHSNDTVSEKQKRIVDLEEEVYGLYARNDEQIIADQNKSISSLTEQVDSLRRLSYNTFINQFSWIDKLGTMYIRENKLTRNGEKTFYDLVAKEISARFSNNRFIKELSDMIAQYDETILTEIKEMSLIKSEQEVLICLLCGISPAVIAILLNKSTRAIYNLKVRIKEKLTCIDSPISHKIIEMITN